MGFEQTETTLAPAGTQRSAVGQSQQMPSTETWGTATRKAGGRPVMGHGDAPSWGMGVSDHVL